MADEFHSGLCSTMSWWNTIRNPTSFDFPPSASCSAAVGDISNESVSWPQPAFLPVELNQIQTGFVDSSVTQFREMNDPGLLPGFFEPVVDPFRDINDSVMQASWANKFSPNQFPRVSSPSKQQLNFSNNTPFWNPTANSAPLQFHEPRIQDESSCSNLTKMKSSETKKQGSDQPAAKKPRIATPSPLPTFKVRKEKLGDRITALQQLVSPFGKTDTASVLQEAIDYIKFLHGQVDALGSPYLKNGHQMQHQKSMDNSKDEQVQDLRSRGLCLVPISSTFAMASETPMDFWAPTFLGSYR